MELPFEQFPALSAIEICRHAFTQRIPGIDVSHDKAEVLKRLDAAHREIRNAIGVGDWPLFTAQQIHGNKIAVVVGGLRQPTGRTAASQPRICRLRWNHHQSTRYRARRLCCRLLRGLHCRSKNAGNWSRSFRSQRHGTRHRNECNRAND